MNIEIDKFKTIILTIIVSVFLVSIVIGASYSYFTASSSNEGGTNTILSTTETAGSVTLRKSDASLKLDLTAQDMANSSNDITYYATTTGTPSTTEVIANIATATLEGLGEMTCDYDITATLSGTTYDAFKAMNTASTNQLILNVDGVDYDLYDTTFPLNIKKTMANLTQSDLTEDIKASFRIVNKSNLNQNAIAGTNLSVNFTVNDFACKLDM